MTIFDQPRNIRDFHTPFLVAAADAPSRYRAMASIRCDGTGDDHEDIQEAIDHAVANGIDVMLSPGTFVYSEQIILKSGLVMRGAHRRLTKLKLADGAAPAGHHLYGENKSLIDLIDLTVDGNRDNQTVVAGDGIRFLDSQAIKLLRVGIINIMSGTSGGNGVCVDACQDVDYLFGYSANCRHGVVTTTGATRDVRTIGWTSENNRLEGIHYSEGQRGLIHSCITRNNTSHNISVTSSSRITLSDNTAIGSVGASGIACSASPYLIAKGNHCLENRLDGISMGIDNVANEGWLIAENICRQNRRDGIRARSSRHYTLALNRTAGNTENGIDIASAIANRGDGLIQSNVCQGENITIDSTNMARVKLYDNTALAIDISGSAPSEIIQDRNSVGF